MTLVEQIGLGLYIGVMTASFVGLLVFGLAFVFHYLAGINFPGMIAMMIGLGAAGLQGGVRALIRNPDLLRSPVSVVALIVTMFVALYAQQLGKTFAKSLPPKEVLLRTFRKKTLSPDVMKSLGRFGQVRISTVGEVTDMEGYLPLPDAIRTAIRDGEWTFPADLPVAELEKRLADKLKSEHDLDDVAVSIDERGRATISAAPPSRGLSRRVPEDKQAVSAEVLVPSGLAAGDDIRVDTGDDHVRGTVLAISAPEREDADADPPADDDDSGAEDQATATPPAHETAAGGLGRVTLTVDPSAVSTMVENEATQLLVRPRGRNREYELISLLRQDGNGFRKLMIRPECELVDTPLGELNLRETFGVGTLAIKRADEWLFAPDGTTALREDDELFVTGPQDGLTGLQAVIE